MNLSRGPLFVNMFINNAFGRYTIVSVVYISKSMPLL